MSDIVSNEPQEKDLSRLIDRVKTSNPPVKSSIYVGQWFPYYEASTTVERPIYLVHRVLVDVANKLHEEGITNPELLDLGSGDGLICAIGSGVYSRVTGIEAIPEVHNYAVRNIQEMESEGIVESGKVDLRQGSYYLRKDWDLAYRFWESDGHDALDAMTMLSEQELDEVVPPTAQNLTDKIKEKLEDYREMDEQMNSLLDPNDGKLDERFKVIFWYPSDFLAPYSKEQWDRILRPGTYFVVTQGNAQIDKMVEGDFFENYERQGVEGELGRVFAVYKKK